MYLILNPNLFLAVNAEFQVRIVLYCCIMSFINFIFLFLCLCLTIVHDCGFCTLACVQPR